MMNLVAALAAIVFYIIQSVLLGWILNRVLNVRTSLPRAFVVSAIAFAGMVPLLSHFLPASPSELDQARPLGVGLFVVIAALWTFAGTAALLVGLEILVPTGSLPGIRQVLSTPRYLRQTGRNASIMAIAAKHGLASQLRGFGRRGAMQQELAASLRAALSDAGVTFIKLGQMLSTREDLLPPVYVRELSQLQNRAPAMPFREVVAQL